MHLTVLRQCHKSQLIPQRQQVVSLSVVIMTPLPISATLLGSSRGESDGGGAGAMYIFIAPAAAGGKAGGPIGGGGGRGG